MGTAEVRDTVRGEDGAFTDSCDAAHNLVAYECEYVSVDPGGGRDVLRTQTGEVKAVILDCGGRCQDGACPNVCSTNGEPLRYLGSTDTGARLEDVALGWQYTCELQVSSSDGCAELAPGDLLEIAGTFDGCIGSVGFDLSSDELACTFYPCAISGP